MFQSIEDAIRQAKLTKLEQRIAESLLHDAEEISFMTVAEMAKKLNVSDTSIIRTTRALGFGGFSDFQRFAQQEMRKKMETMNVGLSPKGRVLSKSSQRDKEKLPFQGLEVVMQHFNAVMEANGRDKLDKAVDILVASRVKFICGYRGSACVPYFFAQKLRQFLPGVSSLLTGNSEMIDRVSDITAADCLFVCSFPRYNHMVMAAVEIAQRAGAKVIALTDKATSPIARETDVCLMAGVDFPGFCNTYTAPLFICDLLLLLLSEKINMASNEKADLIEEYSQKLNINYL
ncbi:MAG: HTH-type transcriptional regulator MurR [Desulfovibrio sp.]